MPTPAEFQSAVHGQLGADTVLLLDRFEALAGLASLQAKHGELLPQAFKLLLIVLNHPACLQDTKDRANPLRAEVEAHLTERQVEAAHKQARVEPLDQVVGQILREGS